MKTKEELVEALEGKGAELVGRVSRHEGRVRAYERVAEFVDGELTDADNDVERAGSKLAKVEKYLDGKISTTQVEVVDESSVRVRNINRILGA